MEALLSEREIVLQNLFFLFFLGVGIPVLGQSPEIRSFEDEPVESRLIRVTGEIARTGKLVRRIDAQQESLREEINAGGLNPGNRLMLEETRRSLPSVATSQQRIVWEQQENRWLKLQILELEQNVDLELNSPAGVAADHAQVPGENDVLHKMHEYSVALGKLAVAHQSLIDYVRSMHIFLDRQLLWVANVHPVSLSDFKQLQVCTTQLGNPKPWLELGRRFASRLNDDPWQLGVVVLLVIASGVTAHRLGGDSVGRNKEKPVPN